MKLHHIGLGFAGAVGAIALAVAPSASASTPTPRPVHYPVTATTHTSQHADTTSVTGTCTVPSANGPVWAYDALSLTLKVVPEGTVANRYVVTIKADGSFKAVADPVTGNCAVVGTTLPKGTIKGTLTYVVDSTTAPRASYVPRNEPGTLGQFAILNQLFGGNATLSAGYASPYTYTYKKTSGSWTVVGNFYNQVG
jgi:hypothetical protein